jgi:hypothetical protein
MIKTSLLTLAFLISFNAATVAQCDCQPAQDWQNSFTSGDPVDATEVRQFAVFDSKLYAATGSWMDQNQPKGTAHVIRLDSPTSKWINEVDFGDGTTGGLARLHWAASKNYSPVNIDTLVASIWSGATVFSKNLENGKWIRTNLDPNGQIRAFATHDDQVAHEFWGFAGGKPGIYRGQLLDDRPAGVSPIEWTVNGASKLELNTVNMNLPLCSGGGRITGFAEARGRIFASACWRIFERVDGTVGNCNLTQVQIGGVCQPRWKRFWDDPLAAQGESGLRGLTQVMYNGQQVLLVGSESGNMHITRLDPDTGQSVVEINISTYLNNLWGLNSGYGIIPYDAPANLWYGPDGYGRRLFGFEVWLPGAPTKDMARKLVNIDDGSPQVMNGEGFFFIRNSASSYQLIHIPASAATQLMTAIRDIIASPFKEDCNEKGQDCAVFAGTFDANKSATQTPCTVAPCTFPPLVAVPTHGSGAIVKGRITLDAAALAAPQNEGSVEAAPQIPHIGSGEE